MCTRSSSHLHPLVQERLLDMECHGRQGRRFPATACRFFLCRGFCVGARPSTISSEGGDTPRSDLDNKRVIILEIQSRRMRAKLRGNHSFDTLGWKISATAGEPPVVAPKDKEGEEDGNGEEDDFFSVKSCFTHCSSENGTDYSFVGLQGRPPAVFEEFRHCKGWPFGLSRKPVMLPPLPRSPCDSWTWHKRNLMAKTH